MNPTGALPGHGAHRIPIFVQNSNSTQHEIVLVDPQILFEDFKTLIKDIFVENEPSANDSSAEGRSQLFMVQLEARHELAYYNGAERRPCRESGGGSEISWSRIVDCLISRLDIVDGSKGPSFPIFGRDDMGRLQGIQGWC